MVIAPQTDVFLLKVPLEINDINQLTFADATAQYNYFSSLPKKEYDNFTYQRKDGVIRIPELIDDIIEYNYVMYRNTAYSDKWFYGFITDMEYLNDNVTAVSIKTDVWQSWMFNLTFKPVFIDREHTNDDRVGLNTLPEGMELGEIVVNQNTTDFGASVDFAQNKYWIVIDVSMVENEGDGQTLAYSWTGTSQKLHPLVNGMPSGLYHLIVGQYTAGGDTKDIQMVLDVYDNAGLGDAIENIYIVPKELIPTVHSGFVLTSTNSLHGTPTTKSVDIALPAESTLPSNMNAFDYDFDMYRYLVDYKPVNNKLYTFPFNYFCISNNAGVTVPFHYEDFDITNFAFKRIKFRVLGALCPSGSIKAIPLDYKAQNNELSCLDYGVTGAKYPMLAWTTDSYTNWLTQNSVNLDFQKEQVLRESITESISNTIQGAIEGGQSGGIKGGVFGGVTSAVTSAINASSNLMQQTRSELAQKKSANITPDQARGNINAGDLVWSMKQGKFTYIPMCIRPELARCIDDYFSHYGYKTNRVKVPNITGRRNWNYVRTIGCYIEGDVPQADLQEIKSMFDRGITFWHNPETFADYTQNNDII